MAKLENIQRRLDHYGPFEARLTSGRKIKVVAVEGESVVIETEAWGETWRTSITQPGRLVGLPTLPYAAKSTLGSWIRAQLATNGPMTCHDLREAAPTVEMSWGIPGALSKLHKHGWTKSEGKVRVNIGEGRLKTYTLWRLTEKETLPADPA